MSTLISHCVSPHLPLCYLLHRQILTSMIIYVDMANFCLNAQEHAIFVLYRGKILCKKNPKQQKRIIILNKGKLKIFVTKKNHNQTSKKMQTPKTYSRITFLRKLWQCFEFCVKCDM